MGAASGDTVPDEPDARALQAASVVFGLLAATMRVHIIWVLANGECDVGTLAERVGGSVPAVSQHLAKLKLAGLVRSRREGRHQMYLVDDPHVVTAVRLMIEHQSGATPGSGHAHGLG